MVENCWGRFPKIQKKKFRDRNVWVQRSCHKRFKRDSFSTQSQSIIQLARGKLVVKVGGGGVWEKEDRVVGHLLNEIIVLTQTGLWRSCEPLVLTISKLKSPSKCHPLAFCDFYLDGSLVQTLFRTLQK